MKMGLRLRLALPVLAVLFLSLFVGPPVSADSSSFVGWKYFKTLSINNPGIALYDFQVPVSLVDADFPEHAAADGSDIRFGDASGNMLDYWIEMWDSANKIARIWVKTPELPAGATTEIRLYYGNPDAVDAGSGSDVFLLFDDFNGSVLNPAKWAVTVNNPANTVTVHDGVADLFEAVNYEWFSLHGASYDLVGPYLKLIACSRVTSIELQEDCYVSLTNPYYGLAGFWARALEFPNIMAVTINPAYPNNRWGHTSNIQTDVPSNTAFHRYELRLGPCVQEYYLDGMFKLQTFDDVPPPYQPFFYFDHLIDGNHMYIDYVAVAQGCPQEPTVGLGAEQNTDDLPPTTTMTSSPQPNGLGWNSGDVAVTISAEDNEGGSGVKEITYILNGGTPITTSGGEASLLLADEGVAELFYFASDQAGNVEPAKNDIVRIDRTLPIISGLPAPNTILWPPNKKMVTVAVISAQDAISGLAAFSVDVVSSESASAGAEDVIILGNGTGPRTVSLRAAREGNGPGRIYTITAMATDKAGNTVTAVSTVLVPHDRGTPQV